MPNPASLVDDAPGPAAPSVPQRERLYEEIVSRVQGQILAGELKPGDRLPAEREMAARLGVSRAAVREAIKSLKEKGLIEVVVGRGAFVTAPSPDRVADSISLLLHGQRQTLEHVRQARQLLEIPIARLAARQRAPRNLFRLRELVERMEAIGDASHQFIALDSDFHLELARATGNPVLEVLSQTMLEMLRGERVYMMGVHGEMADALAAHRRIQRAVERGDGDEAARAMSDHLAHLAGVIRNLGAAPR
ncbi:MAG TPA: FadR/GntR family transcriptional regulator, partial [Gemmatimonadaceae bacterium]